MPVEDSPSAPAHAAPVVPRASGHRDALRRARRHIRVGGWPGRPGDPVACGAAPRTPRRPTPTGTCSWPTRPGCYAAAILEPAGGTSRVRRGRLPEGHSPAERPRSRSPGSTGTRPRRHDDAAPDPDPAVAGGSPPMGGAESRAIAAVRRYVRHEQSAASGCRWSATGATPTTTTPTSARRLTGSAAGRAGSTGAASAAAEPATGRPPHRGVGACAPRRAAGAPVVESTASGAPAGVELAPKITA